MRVLLIVLLFWITGNIGTARACEYGGYTQILPLAKNDLNELWVFHLRLLRAGGGQKFMYESQLRIYNDSFILLDTILLNKGERYIAKTKKRVVQRQAEWLVDSLYTHAVRELTRLEDSLKFVWFKGSGTTVSDSFGDFLVTRRQEIEHSQNEVYKGDTIRQESIDTAYNIVAISYRGKEYRIDSLLCINSNLYEVYSPDSWKSVFIKSARFYEIEEARFLLLHFDVLRPFYSTSSHFAKSNTNARSWTNEMYQNLSWHHSGQEVLLWIR